MTSPSQPHYFATPSGPEQRRTIRVTVAGHEVTVDVADGVFSADRVDLGTRVLLREVPAPPTTGDLLDLGCGWGPITLALGLSAPRATIWAVDVNERALALTADNARRAGLSGVRARTPDAVDPDVRFAAIWSNPPIRVGKSELHRLLTHWLPRLLPGASAHLVVQRHLGADSLHDWLIGELGDDFAVVRAGSAKGYRVLRVTRAG